MIEEIDLGRPTGKVDNEVSILLECSASVLGEVGFLHCQLGGWCGV
jgi:hypothetical protein